VTTRAEYTKEFLLPCDCGCSVLGFTYWEDDDDALFFSHYESSHTFMQRTIRTRIGKYFKRIWCAIVGKEYLFYEVSVAKDDLVRFKEYVNSIHVGEKI